MRFFDKAVLHMQKTLRDEWIQMAEELRTRQLRVHLPEAHFSLARQTLILNHHSLATRATKVPNLANPIRRLETRRAIPRVESMMRLRTAVSQGPSTLQHMANPSLQVARRALSLLLTSLLIESVNRTPHYAKSPLLECLFMPLLIHRRSSTLSLQITPSS